MRLKHFALGILVSAAGLGSSVSYADVMKADTLNLVSATGAAVTVPAASGNGTEATVVYPYNFSVDGSSTLTSLMCLNMNDEVTIGETWSVNEQTLTPASKTAYLEDAWIFAQMGQVNPVTHAAYTNTEVQLAVWDVLDSAAASAGAFDATSAYLVSQAQTKATTQGALTAGFLAQFTVYTPTSDTTGWTAGTPQSYIGGPSALTPEPSTLLLLGGGVLVGGVLVLRRRKNGVLLATELQ